MSFLSMPKPQDYTAWQASLVKNIDNAPLEHVFFWLIDPCAHPELPELIWQLDPNPDAWPLYMNTYLEEAMNTGPFMLLYKKNSGLTGWLWREMWAAPLCCLVEAKKTQANELFQHFQNLLECKNPQGKSSIFRFYDPRLLYGISTYQDADVTRRILGPSLHMMGWEPGRQVPVHLGLGTDMGFRSEGLESYDEAFFEHLWDENRVHATIGTLGHKTGMKLRAMPLAEAYKLVEEVQRILWQYHYTDRYSLAYGSSVTARLGLAVWDRPDLRETLATRPMNAPLAEIMESLDI